MNNNLRFNRQKWVLWLLIITIVTLWGLGWVYMKAVLNFMGPITFNAFRFIIGSVTLLIIAGFMKFGLPEKQYWKPLIIVGLLQTGAVFLLVMFGLQFVEAGKSSVLLYSMPLWSSLLAIKYLKEKLSMKQITGLLIGMVGLLTILGWDIWIGQNWNMIIGELLITVAAVLWAGANIYFRLYLNDLPKIQSSAYQMSFGSIALLLVALMVEWGEPIVWTGESIFYVLFSGIISSALCFTVWYMILSMIDMATATIATLLVPIFGLLFSGLMLSEKITSGVMVGTMLIIFGILVTQVSKKGRKRVIEKENSA